MPVPRARIARASLWSRVRSWLTATPATPLCSGCLMPERECACAHIEEVARIARERIHAIKPKVSEADAFVLEQFARALASSRLRWRRR